jgi:hypothetical protein
VGSIPTLGTMESVSCLICRARLEVLFGQEGISRSSAINDGGTVEISFGYGSQNDCKMALGFLCDKCFNERKDLCINHYDGLHKQT